MGTLRAKLPNFKKQKAVKFTPKHLIDRKTKKPTNAKYIQDDKLDGLRGLLIVRKNLRQDRRPLWTANAYTSNGSLVPNAALICKAIVSKLTKNPHSLPVSYRLGFVLDGEFEATNWNDTNSAVTTQTYEEDLAQSLTLHVFDGLSIAHWDAKECDITQYVRKCNASAVVAAIGSKRLKELKYKIHKKLTVEIVAEELANAVKKGKEGVMFKLYDGLYRFKPSKDWLKVKPVYKNTEDLKIIGAEIGTEGKRNGKRLGALTIKGKVNGKTITTNCGTGFKDKDREELWKLHKQGKLIGLYAEVLFDNVTVGSALRFARFVRLRKDK